MSTREEAMASAEAVLTTLTASNLFNMNGVVAVVTGGGSVSANVKSIMSQLMFKCVDRALD